VIISTLNLIHNLVTCCLIFRILSLAHSGKNCNKVDH